MPRSTCFPVESCSRDEPRQKRKEREPETSEARTSVSEIAFSRFRFSPQSWNRVRTESEPRTNKTGSRLSAVNYVYEVGKQRDSPLPALGSRSTRSRTLKSARPVSTGSRHSHRLRMKSYCNQIPVLTSRFSFGVLAEFSPRSHLALKRNRSDSQPILWF